MLPISEPLTPLSKAVARDIALAHVDRQLKASFETYTTTGGLQVFEGWPAGAYQVSEDPVWAIALSEKESGVGAIRFVVISQRTGRVLFYGGCGE